MSPNSIAIVILSVAVSICASVAAQPAQPAQPAQAPATQPCSGADYPREAARRFAQAFMNPTRQGLRDVVCGKTPAEEHAADIWASSISGQFRVQEALRK